MKIFAECQDFVFEFEYNDNGGNPVLKTDGENQEYSFLSLGQNRYSLIHNDKSHLLQIIKENGIYHVHLDGYHFPFLVEDERMRALSKLVQHSVKSTGEHVIKAPIPGMITLIKVREGDVINTNDSLLILEAMKMENEIKANFSGKISKIYVSQNSPVEKDQDLLIITSE
jgi:biotin carboxyl carrier protein